MTHVLKTQIRHSRHLPRITGPRSLFEGQVAIPETNRDSYTTFQIMTGQPVFSRNVPPRQKQPGFYSRPTMKGKPIIFISSDHKGPY